MLEDLNTRGSIVTSLGILVPYLIGGRRLVRIYFTIMLLGLVLGRYSWNFDLDMSKGQPIWDKADPVESIEDIQGAWTHGEVVGYDYPRGVVFMNALDVNGWQGKEFKGDKANALVFNKLNFVPVFMKYNHPGGEAHLVQAEVDGGVKTIAMAYDILPIIDYFKWEKKGETLIGLMKLMGKPVAFFRLRR
jgi:hypothetical protein